VFLISHAPLFSLFVCVFKPLCFSCWVSVVVACSFVPDKTYAKAFIYLQGLFTLLSLLKSHPICNYIVSSFINLVKPHEELLLIMVQEEVPTNEQSYCT